MPQKLVFAFLTFSLLIGAPITTHAGVFGDILGFFIGTTDAIEEIVADNNSQTATLLKPMSAVLVSAEGETPIVEDSALIADIGPMGTIADVEYLTPANNKIEAYMVEKGDNLSSIAKMFGISAKTIMWVNNISNERLIRPGQTLIILPISGVKHKIKSGDTIKSIARIYGGNVEEILKYNNIGADDKLVIGEEIIVPDGEIKTVKTASPAASRSVPSYNGYYIKPAVNVRRTQGYHGTNGVDLAPYTRKSGTEPILAAASGKVIVAKYSGWNGGYGKLIIISHNNGTQTVYAHADSIFVSVGEYVSQGQMIGMIGNTGKSTGPHLHFEIRGARNPF